MCIRDSKYAQCLFSSLHEHLGFIAIHDIRLYYRLVYNKFCFSLNYLRPCSGFNQTDSLQNSIFISLDHIRSYIVFLLFPPPQKQPFLYHS